MATPPVRIRVIDLETTGTLATDHIVEIAAVDIVEGEIIPVGSHLIRPPVPIPPEASAIHHLVDEDVEWCDGIEDPLAYYMDVDGAAGVTSFAAHNMAFEANWIAQHVRQRSAICTLKCALHLWPNAPSHTNQTLRYFLRPKGLDPHLAAGAHRALPDAYVTALVLREMLALTSPEELVRLTGAPALLKRVPFGKHRGAAWQSVPSDYLRWIMRTTDLNEDVRHTAAHHIQLRESGRPQQQELQPL